MKKHATLLMALLAALLLVMAGCGGGGGGGGDVPPGDNPPIGDPNVDTDNDGVTDDLDADDDNDGLPDAFEVANGLNRLDPADAARDPDNDGLTNTQEFVAGTNPQNADTDADGVVDGSDDAPTNAAQFATFGTPLTLGRLAGARFSSASAANSGGLVAGVSDNASGVVSAVIWNVSTGIAPFNPTQLGGGDGTYGAAFDVNENDLVVGEASVGGVITAMLWPVNETGTPGAAVPLGSLTPTAQSSAYAIDSVNGIVVGESQNAAGAVKAVLWTVNPTTGAKIAGPMELPLPADATASAAYDIADRGDLVGEFTNSAGVVRGAVWLVSATGVAGPVVLAPPGGGTASSIAYSVNEDRQAVGLAVAADGSQMAVAWNYNTPTPAIRSLATTGTPSNAWAVGPTGRVMGRSGTGAVAWQLGFINPAATAPVTVPTATGSQAHAIAATGMVAGMFETAAGGQQAFVIPRN